jgi:hyaluronoglucosaminidase
MPRRQAALFGWAVAALACGWAASGAAPAAELVVQLPQEVRPLPEPLPAGRTEPGFRIRGIKGWNWTPDQYLEEIPVLAEHKMNFLMNCYLSMFSHHPQWRNDWWEPIPESRMQAYEKVIRACQKRGIQYCFAMHPQLSSSRPLDPTSDADFEEFWPHYAWAQGLGVKWFCVSLDDVSWGTKGPGGGGADHSRLVSRLLGRLRVKDPDAQLVFCPVPYWGDGSDPQHRAYLEAVGREMDPAVYLFWTGDAVVTPRITRQAAEKYKGIAKHRLILWDNYPVNDDQPTLHLGPVTGRDPSLHEVVDGYMSNPMCKQSQSNRIPLLTCADYAYNPQAYDPVRSIGQAIAHLADAGPPRQALKDLVEAYPGMPTFGGGTGTNPVRERFKRLRSAPDSQAAAAAYAGRMEELSTRLGQVFPDRFREAQKILAGDVAWLREASRTAPKP